MTLLRFFKILVFVFSLMMCGSCKRTHHSPANKDAIQVPNEKYVDYMKPYLQNGFLVRMVPKGNSMLPTLRNGEEVVTLKHTDNVQPGDIVLALTSYGHYVIHRVVSVNGKHVTLKGDHNQSTETALITDVLATLVDKEPYLRENGEKQGQPLDGKNKFKSNPLYRIDTVDTLAWLVDTLNKKVDMHRAVVFNETALLVWNTVAKSGFTINDMASCLTKNYEVDDSTAFNDCRRLLAAWRDCGLVVSAGQ